MRILNHFLNRAPEQPGETPPFPEAPVLRDRVMACLYGGALGDALGYAIEFDRWQQIQAEYGPEGIRDLVLDRGEARFSDDTQMTLFTAEGMGYGFFRATNRGAGASVESYIYQAYLCWLQTQGVAAESLWDPVSRLKQVPGMNHRRAPGNTCLSALCSGQMGTIDAPLNHSSGCGGVMRAAPLGLVRCRWNQKSPFGPALECGARAAAITHGAPLGWLPAGMLADMIDRCVYGGYTSLRQLTEDALAATEAAYPQYPETASFAGLIRRAIQLAQTPAGEHDIAAVDEPAIRSLGEGWVGDEALAIAIYAALRYPGDLRRGLLAAVNHSGDSDSTGSIAGNILGAYLGMDAIPRDWLARLELTDEIEAVAELLLRVVETV